MRNLTTALLVAVCCGVNAQISIVVPPQASNRDAAGLTDFAGFHRRVQQQIIVREGLLTGFTEITGLAVRRDGHFASALTGGRVRLSMWLSRAMVSPTQASDLFATNRGSSVLVFSGEVAIPDSPALPHRDAATWSSPHAVEIPFTTPFAYVDGDLCIEVQGEPVAGATSPWWPIDCTLYTHDGQVTEVGSSCDPEMVASAARASLQPGTSAWLFATGRAASAGIAMIDVEARAPGIPLDVLGATGCVAHVNPLVTLGTTFVASPRRTAGDASLRLNLPATANLLGGTLGVQWLSFPSPRNAAGFTTSSALRLRLASTRPPFDAVQVRTGPLTFTESWPIRGEVLINRAPVLRILGR